MDFHEVSADEAMPLETYQMVELQKLHDSADNIYSVRDKMIAWIEQNVE